MNLRQPSPPRPRPRPPVGTEGMHEETVVVDGEVKRALVEDDTAPLPPAGDARKDTLKERQDRLESRLEQIADAMGLDNDAGPPINLSDYSIENEIASKFDYVRVTNPIAERAYYWANYAAAHGIDVTAHTVQGWKVVAGDDPECPECRDEIGRRKIGDTILMWIPLDQYLQLRQRDRVIRKLRSEGLEAALEEMGERWRGRGIRLHKQLDDYQTQRALRRSQAKQIARHRLDGMLRDGTVKGL